MENTRFCSLVRFTIPAALRRGLPFWLHDVPGIVYRSDNKPFKYHMERYARTIVEMLKAEKLYASQGGPIILSQIENEYQNVEAAFHEKGPSYVKWAAKMAVGLQTGVPWVMCMQDDAPDPVINACNGLRCGETFAGPNSPNKPAIWTEDWTTLFEAYGRESRMRSAEGIAFHVALFIAKGGSFVNYYMYHGGTNFERTGTEYVPTSYYDQAPLDEYGMFRQPKWGHLKELHAAIKICVKPLLSATRKNLSLGQQQEAFVFERRSGQCAAFLINNDRRSNVMVNFKNSSYKLPPTSISILPDCKAIAFNTAQVNAQYGTRSANTRQKFDSIEQWEEYKESIPSFDETSLRLNMLLDQMNTTKDSSDYLWYTLRFQRNSSDAHSVLMVDSRAHNLHAFVNGVFIGSAHGSHDKKRFTLEKPFPLKRGTNYISLLSVMSGLPDFGAYLERRVAGIRGMTIQHGHELNNFDSYLWGYKVGLSGENMQLHTDDGARKAQWSSYRNSMHQSLTWYKTIFDAPPGKEPVVLNLGSMGKGEAWVNGQSIGRYWISFLKPDGSPYQTLYHVPRSFLRPSGNLLVLLEEENGYPRGISIGTVSITKVCSHVSTSHPPPVISWQGKNHTMKYGRRPKVQLRCPPRRKISSILFSSFGTPSGDCQTYSTGSCHSPNSRAIVEKACLGKVKCSIPLSQKRFGVDPCPGVVKSLLVDVKCT